MSNNYGWLENPAAVDEVMQSLPRPLFGDALPMDPTKEMLLYEFVRKVKGEDAQCGPQGIGDCVSWGYGVAIDYLQCIQAATNGDIIFEDTLTEAIYALSRCEVGQQFGSYSDGSVGAWAAKAVNLFGSLGRTKHGAYNAKRSKEWGAKGLPNDLEPSAAKHLVKTVSQVRSWEEFAAAVQNGYPVPICSSQGFSMVRDSEGFCRPEGTWMHCMLGMAVRFDRPGGCLAQSWGKNTPSGGLGKNQPTNSFWVDAKVIDKMLRQGDSFALSQHQSFQILDWSH